jgi:uncharacterized Fe-S center protein
VKTNTLYKGKRYTTADHRETLKINGWDFCPVDIMDEEGSVMIPVKGGKHFKEMSVGKRMLKYDSMVVLTHFKGHAMGGFGGSMKNIAIDCAISPSAVPTDLSARRWSTPPLTTRTTSVGGDEDGQRSVRADCSLRKREKQLGR